MSPPCYLWCPACNAVHDRDRPPKTCPRRRRSAAPSEVPTPLEEHPHPVHVDELQQGTLVDGRYVVESLLGRGGMGAIFRATDLRVGREVALKTLDGDFSEASIAARRFLREAQIMAAITHPGVVRVFDFGAVGPFAYIVMELLQGVTLADALDDGRFEIQEACAVACQILATLSVVHAQGYMHRDLKPANVFLARSSQGRTVKLLDFGLSREMRESAVRLTRPGTVLGTPHYLAPAVILGDPPSAATDVYATGLLFYEMLTGSHPIEFRPSSSVVETFRTIIHAPRRLPQQLRPELPDAVAEIARRAVTPDEGYATAIDLFRAIDATQGHAYARSELARLLPPQS